VWPPGGAVELGVDLVAHALECNPVSWLTFVRMPMSRTAPDPSLTAVADAFQDFLRALRHQRGRVAARPDGDELSLAQYHLLQPLDDGEASGLRALAERAGVAPPTATKMLDGLVERGLVARERCPEDRRAVRIRLTPEGREAVALKRAMLAERRAAVFADFTPEERRDAARLLERLAGAVEAFR
jgi:DNA-binding MarR family transcriptional regulator